MKRLLSRNTLDDQSWLNKIERYHVGWFILLGNAAFWSLLLVWST